MGFTKLKNHRCFDGEVVFCEHDSNATKTKMKFSYFAPKGQSQFKKAIIWLSGLTCTDENFITKAGSLPLLAETGTMIICPDTSPRGLSLPGENDSYDFGSGAGFYVNATTAGYADHYNMYDYVTKDLVSLLKEDFGVSEFGITGHSMGGHGALVIGLRESDLFSSISAFSPIVNPTQCPWGKKALKGYLGEDIEAWKSYDACELIGSGKTHKSKILIDQGLGDQFFEEQLLTDNFQKACDQANQPVSINYREGYDHSYYFISTFIEEHIKFHLAQVYSSIF